MKINWMAFALGQKGVVRGDLLSAAVGKRKGGGSTTLEESGWIKAVGANVEVSGNTVSLKTGNYHTLDIAPPVEVRDTNKFVAGDVFVIAMEVTENYRTFGVYSASNGSSTTSCDTDYFNCSGNSALSGQWGPLGSGAVTFDFLGNSAYVRARPAANDGSSSGTAYATFTVTGMWFNGEKII